ncbi:hypothetical protein V8C86DRAFT_2470316 [Haematococcus lacustris]
MCRICAPGPRVVLAFAPRIARTRTAASPLPAQGGAAQDAPWGFGFQVNERYLQWDDSAARQLIKLTLSHRLDVSVEEVEVRLQELGVLLPDLVSKLERMRVDLLHPLLHDLRATARKLMGLKDLLPGVNISLLVSRLPSLLVDWELDALSARLDVMRRQLPGVNVVALVDAEPMLLKADLAKVLASIERLMPAADSVGVLVAQPQMVLDMEQAGMGSAIDVEGYAL